MPNSNVFIGWDSQSFVCEFSYDGELLLNGRFPPECESYRTFLFPCSGHPTEDPAVAVEQRPENKVELTPAGTVPQRSMPGRCSQARAQDN